MYGLRLVMIIVCITTIDRQEEASAKPDLLGGTPPLQYPSELVTIVKRCIHQAVVKELLEYAIINRDQYEVYRNYVAAYDKPVGKGHKSVLKLMSGPLSQWVNTLRGNIKALHHSKTQDVNNIESMESEKARLERLVVEFIDQQIISTLVLIVGRQSSSSPSQGSSSSYRDDPVMYEEALEMYLDQFEITLLKFLVKREINWFFVHLNSTQLWNLRHESSKLWNLRQDSNQPGSWGITQPSIRVTIERESRKPTASYESSHKIGTNTVGDDNLVDIMTNLNLPPLTLRLPSDPEQTDNILEVGEIPAPELEESGMTLSVISHGQYTSVGDLLPSQVEALRRLLDKVIDLTVPQVKNTSLRMVGAEGKHVMADLISVSQNRLSELYQMTFNTGLRLIWSLVPCSLAQLRSEYIEKFMGNFKNSVEIRGSLERNPKFESVFQSMEECSRILDKWSDTPRTARFWECPLHSIWSSFCRDIMQSEEPNKWDHLTMSEVELLTLKFPRSPPIRLDSPSNQLPRNLRNFINCNLIVISQVSSQAKRKEATFKFLELILEIIEKVEGYLNKHPHEVKWSKEEFISVKMDVLKMIKDEYTPEYFASNVRTEPSGLELSNTSAGTLVVHHAARRTSRRKRQAEDEKGLQTDIYEKLNISQSNIDEGFIEELLNKLSDPKKDRRVEKKKKPTTRSGRIRARKGKKNVSLTMSATPVTEVSDGQTTTPTGQPKAHGPAWGHLKAKEVPGDVFRLSWSGLVWVALAGFFTCGFLLVFTMVLTYCFWTCWARRFLEDYRQRGGFSSDPRGAVKLRNPFTKRKNRLDRNFLYEELTSGSEH